MAGSKNKDVIAIIPDGTQVIEAYAFDSCTWLESVVIPKGVSKIEDYAFKDCSSLTTVILPFSVTEIGEYSFDGCTNLATIYVPEKMVDLYETMLLPMGLHAKIAPGGDMSWDEAIIKVLAKKGSPMRAGEILKEIIKQGYRLDLTQNPEGTVGSYLRDKKKGLYKKEAKGLYNLVGTSAPTPHSHKAVGGKVTVDVRPCALYGSDNPAYKKASSFIDSPVPSQDEKDLLELIVNFQLPLDKEEVCFADILNDLKVVFSDEDKKRDQDDIDKDFLQEKLNELKTKMEITEREKERNPDRRDELGDLLNRMDSAAKAAQDLLDGASGDKVLRLGEFIPPKGDGLDKPKVVIYYKNIESFCEKNYSERWKVMAGVFVHEMFHAWNYFHAGGKRSVLAIDEPMVEFETLYFLKQLEAFTHSQSHPLHDEVERVSRDRLYRVQKKQQEVGDLAAYGFGYYLFDNLSDAAESRDWIETYSKKSAKIQEKNPHVENAKKALIPVYPFLPEDEAAVKKLFKKIIFNKRVIPASAEKFDATKTGSHVSLRDLLLACIETIGRKCFDAQELYAFAPIFRACMPHCSDLEEALKQQLDELVKEGHLDVLPHDCYSIK
mgnify:CR=1 FL=1